MYSKSGIVGLSLLLFVAFSLCCLDPEGLLGQDDPFNAPQNKDPFRESTGGSGAIGRDPFSKDDARPGAAPAKSVQSLPSAPNGEHGAAASRLNSLPAVPIPVVPQGVAYQRIQTMLGREAEMQYLDTPLKDVLDDNAFRHDIPIAIDTKALKSCGIETTEPITISLRGVTLRSGLRLMLRQVDLTFAVQDEVLLVTTPEAAQSLQSLRIYPVGELLPAQRAMPDGGHGPAGRASALVEAITGTIAPNSWQVTGGPGGIYFIDNLQVIVVSQTEDAHYELASLLDVLKSRVRQQAE